jgi:hypothetical protein
MLEEFAPVFIWTFWAVWFYWVIRSQYVFYVRRKLLDSDINLYHMLPSYFEMMSPKYILLWKTKHWQAWLQRRQPK